MRLLPKPWDEFSPGLVMMGTFATDVYQSGKNYVFTTNIPDSILPAAGNLWGGGNIGFWSTTLFGIPIYPRTRQNTLVVQMDCKTVATSHPGPPNR